MQRLFATFPDGQPGAALLLLRLSLAGILVFHSATYWEGPPSVWVSAACDCIGLLLTLGLFTPFIAIASSVVGAAALLFGRGFDPVTGSFVLAVMAALGMLGAGAYSLDARIYGRREVVVGKSR